MEANVKLIISVNEARKLLGKDASILSDDQIIDYILALTGIAANYLSNVSVPKNV